MEKKKKKRINVCLLDVFFRNSQYGQIKICKHLKEWDEETAGEGKRDSWGFQAGFSPCPCGNILVG